MEPVCEKRLCPPGLIPHRSDVYKEFSRHFAPFAIVVTRFQQEGIMSRRKVGITDITFFGRIPLLVEAFELVSERIALVAEIV